MLHHLVVPLQGACVYIEGDNAVAVEVVTRADRAVEIGIRIAGAENNEPQLGIDRWCRPHHRATALPGVPGIAFRVGGIPTPALLPGFGVVSGYKSAQCPFTPGPADNDHSVIDLRGERLGVAVLRADNGGLPGDLSVG